jgi:hypothetical protein
MDNPSRLPENDPKKKLPLMNVPRGPFAKTIRAGKTEVLP